MHPRRQVDFIVWRTGVTAERLELLIGEAGDLAVTRTDAPLTQAQWVIREVGSEETDLSGLIAKVISRVRNIGHSVTEVCSTPDASVMLRITQYASVDDPVGPGFAIDVDDLAYLSGLRAAIDVDQYVM